MLVLLGKPHLDTLVELGRSPSPGKKVILRDEQIIWTHLQITGVQITITARLEDGEVQNERIPRFSFTTG